MFHIRVFKHVGFFWECHDEHNFDMWPSVYKWLHHHNYDTDEYKIEIRGLTRSEN